MDSVVRDNVAGGFEGSGGGIWSSGRLTLIRTVVTGNRAAGRDPGTHAIDGGGGIHARATLVIRGSTISRNHSSFRGGGVSNGGTMTVFDSSIAENTAEAGGGGLSNLGGTVSLTGTTITGNVAGETGGGIRNLRRGTISLDSTTSVSGNTPDDCFGTSAC